MRKAGLFIRWPFAPHRSEALWFLVCQTKPDERGLAMFFPETYQGALLLMILTMLCWGSWANTLKLCPGYRFQLFYWDYAIGLAACTIVWGLTAGSHGHTGTPFLSDIAQASTASILFAFLGGVIFNIANLLLVAAIDVA